MVLRGLFFFGFWLSFFDVLRYEMDCDQRVRILSRWTKKSPVLKWIQTLNWLKQEFNYFEVIEIAPHSFTEKIQKKLIFFKVKNFENSDVLRAWEASKKYFFVDSSVLVAL